MAKDLFDQIKSALVEKDVENVYRGLLTALIPDAKITSPYKCDGLLKSKLHDLVAIMEFKFDLQMKDRSAMVDVLIQVIYYLKKFELNGERLPSILFVGDINECFVMHTNNVLDYLGMDLDWGVAPNSAHLANPDLKLALYNDANISPYVYDVDANFKFADVVQKMLDLNKGIVRLVRITEKNVNTIFDYFTKNIVKGGEKMPTNQRVGLFMQCLINPSEHYIHPTKKNTLVTTEGMVSVDGAKFTAFFSHFDRNMKPSERDELVKIADRLLEDEKRRRDGAFFTPTAWVDEAHKMITESLGSNWRDEYVVWDCACGTMNLTRDYKFANLYASTLNKDEVDLAIANGINPEAKARFQSNFLDGIEIDNLPEGLKSALTGGKKVLFLINPPYGTACAVVDGDHKAGIATTGINELMESCSMGASRQNLYAQFLFKIAKLKEIYGNENVVIAIFCPPLFITGGSYAKFRKMMYSQFTFDRAMVFQASHFADVSAKWGILFSIWKHGVTDPSNIVVDVKDEIEFDVVN